MNEYKIIHGSAFNALTYLVFLLRQDVCVFKMFHVKHFEKYSIVNRFSL
mgnify:CR=1 FL=1